LGRVPHDRHRGVAGGGGGPRPGEESGDDLRRATERPANAPGGTGRARTVAVESPRAFRSRARSPYSYHPAVSEGGEVSGSACPSNEHSAQVIGGAPETSGSWVVDPLEGCPACQRRLDRLVSQASVPPWARAALGRTADVTQGTPDPAFLASLRGLVP